MEVSSDFQQRGKRAAMGSHSPSASVDLSTQSHRCSEPPSILDPWREPSPEEYRSIYDDLDAPNTVQQPNSYRPYHQLEYEAQGLLRDVTDPRLGPSYRPFPVSSPAIRGTRSGVSTDSAGVSYTGTDQNGHSSFRNQDPRRLAAMSNQTSNRQTPRKYGRAVKEGLVSFGLGTYKHAVGNHTLDFQEASSPRNPSKH